MGLKQHQKSIGNFIKLNLFDVVSIVSGFNQSKICLHSNLQHAQISFITACLGQFQEMCLCSTF